MYNIGVIGCGRIAQLRHLPEYAANSGARIAAVCDTNYERAQETAEKYGAKACKGYEELLALPEIEAVSICTANFTHADITVAALNAGKNVLCEKPMALDLESCKKMVLAAQANGKHLVIGHNQRLSQTHRKAKELIDEGAIGRVLSCRSVFAHKGPESWSIDSGPNTWFFDKNKAVLGAMADLGIHKTDLIQYLTGQTIVAATAFAGTLDKKKQSGEFIEVEDNAVCIYELSEGAIATVSVSWSCYGEEDNSTIIYGSEGVLKLFADKDHSIIMELKSGERIFYDTEKIQTNDKQSNSGVIDLFLESISEDKETCLSGKEALLSMEAVFSAMDSARLHKTVRVRREGLWNLD